MFLCICHLSSLFYTNSSFHIVYSPDVVTTVHFHPSIYVHINIVSHYVYGVVGCFAHVSPKWSFLFKPSILYGIFMCLKLLCHSVYLVTQQILDSFIGQLNKFIIS